MIDVGDDEKAPRRVVAERMGDAARAWLESLDQKQRRIATGAVPAGDDSDAECRRWFYTPGRRTRSGLGVGVLASRPASTRRT